MCSRSDAFLADKSLEVRPKMHHQKVTAKCSQRISIHQPWRYASQSHRANIFFKGFETFSTNNFKLFNFIKMKEVTFTSPVYLHSCYQWLGKTSPWWKNLPFHSQKRGEVRGGGSWGILRGEGLFDCVGCSCRLAAGQAAAAAAAVTGREGRPPREHMGRHGWRGRNTWPAMLTREQDTVA